MTSVSAYLGLFFSALLAATLFPAQSEAVLLALLHAGQQAPWLLWLVVTLEYPEVNIQISVYQ